MLFSYRPQQWDICDIVTSALLNANASLIDPSCTLSFSSVCLDEARTVFWHWCPNKPQLHPKSPSRGHFWPGTLLRLDHPQLWRRASTVILYVDKVYLCVYLYLLIAISASHLGLTTAAALKVAFVGEATSEFRNEIVEFDFLMNSFHLDRSRQNDEWRMKARRRKTSTFTHLHTDNIFYYTERVSFFSE